MHAHPCSDHPCDHCYCCDVLGICCATVTAGQRAPREASAQVPDQVLHAAVVEDAKQAASLAELVRLDAGSQSQAQSCLAPALRALSGAPNESLPIPRKEALNVIAARPE